MDDRLKSFLGKFAELERRVRKLAAEDRSLREEVKILRQRLLQSEAEAASLRSPTHVIDSALAGAHIGTMPFKVLDMLFNHPLTDKGLDQFLKDWAKVFQETPTPTPTPAPPVAG